MAETASRKPYDTDMTDREWEIYQEIFPEHVGIPGVSEVKHSVREILNAIRYIERTGCQWRNLPHDLPPWGLVANYFSRWKRQGRFQALRELVVRKERERQGRSPMPTAGIIDSQSVKSTEASPTRDRGFDKGKLVKGRKRHLLVDVLGCVLAVLITSASVQDRDGGAMLLTMAHAMYPTLTKVWVDSAYQGPQIEEVIASTGIDVEVKAREEGTKGFVPIKMRWVVERTFGWLYRARRLSKDYERTLTSSQAWIDLAMARIGIARRCREPLRLRISNS